MRIVLQKVEFARVQVDDKIIGEIPEGLLLLVGVTHDDTQEDADWLAEKVLKLKLFAEPGSDSFMEKNIVEQGGGILVISQFTLYGNCRKGTKPSFTNSARPEHAVPVYEHFVSKLRESDLRVDTGEFGEHMGVHLMNDGPITLILDSKNKDF